MTPGFFVFLVEIGIDSRSDFTQSCVLYGFTAVFVLKTDQLDEDDRESCGGTVASSQGEQESSIELNDTTGSNAMNDARRSSATNPRPALIAQAFLLEWMALGWMSVEAAVALWSGTAAHSLTLVAFGFDSVIELASAGVLIWRLTVYVVAGAAWGLRQHQSIAIPTMVILSRAKIRVAEQLGSRALRADAVEAITCGYLSAVVIVGSIVLRLSRSRSFSSKRVARLGSATTAASFEGFA